MNDFCSLCQVFESGAYCAQHGLLHRPFSIGDMDLDELVGAGPRSFVFGGRHRGTSMPVAIKILRPHVAADAEARQRFLREAAALRELVHANVVRVLGAGWDEALGAAYLAMVREPGQSAAELIKASPFAWTQAVPLLLQLCSGVAAAHAAGIIDGHLTARKLLIGTAPGGRFAKLCDVGLSGAVAAAESTTFDDVYGIGTVAHELLTGRLPLEGSSPAGTLSDDPIRVNERFPKLALPEALDDLIRACRLRDPMLRPSLSEIEASLRALAAPLPRPTLGDLEELTAIVPSLAQPPSAPAYAGPAEMPRAMPGVAAMPGEPARPSRASSPALAVPGMPPRARTITPAPATPVYARAATQPPIESPGLPPRSRTMTPPPELPPRTRAATQPPIQAAERRSIEPRSHPAALPGGDKLRPSMTPPPRARTATPPPELPMRARPATAPPEPAARARPVAAGEAALAVAASNVPTRATAPMHAVAAIPGLPHDVAVGTGPAIPGGVLATSSSAVPGLAVAPRSSVPSLPVDRTSPVGSAAGRANLAQSSGPISTFGTLATGEQVFDSELDPTLPIARVSSVDDGDADEAAATFPDGIAALPVEPSRPEAAEQAVRRAGREVASAEHAMAPGGHAAIAPPVGSPVGGASATHEPAPERPRRAGRRWMLVALGGLVFTVALIVGFSLSGSKPTSTTQRAAPAGSGVPTVSPPRAPPAESAHATSAAQARPTSAPAAGAGTGARPTAKQAAPANAVRAAGSGSAQAVRMSVPADASIIENKPAVPDAKLPPGTGNGPVRPRAPALPKPPADRPDI